MKRRVRARAVACAVWMVAAATGCSQPTPTVAGESEPSPSDPILGAINDDYVATVKPLFARSCTSCHGAGNALPWYHSLPLVRGMIDEDLARARRTVDISHDFPFRGRGTPADYLDAVDEVVAERSMPPLRYRAMHWGSALSDGEREIVRSWVERSRRRLPPP
ncbi:MAG: hypothetical protein JWM53_4827 [bacterium]|nr:hypothetical protein [bacterium]